MSKSVDLKPNAGSPKKEKLPSVDSGYAWVIVAVAAIVFMLSVGVFRSQTVFLEPAREKFNVTHGTMTLMSTGVFITSQLLTLPGNVMSEWLGPRVNVIVAGISGVLCFVICAFAPNYPIYFASYVLFQGAAFALCYSPIVVTVNRYFHEYRPLASSIALGGVSIGSMVIPNLLSWLLKQITFKWTLIAAGVCVAITIPIALLIRQITMEQMHAIEAQRKLAAAQPAPPANEKHEANEHSEGDGVELTKMASKEGDTLKKDDPEAITAEPRVVSSGDVNGAEKNDLEAGQKLLPSPPPYSPNSQAGPSQPAPVAEVHAAKKKSCDVASAFAYFKHFPSLFIDPTYLLHAIHFAFCMTIDNVFLSVTFDSFLKDMKTTDQMKFADRTLWAVANFVGRFASGLFLVMPVFIAKCSKGSGNNSSAAACYAKVKKYVTVRILYCTASAFFCLGSLLLSIAALSGKFESPMFGPNEGRNGTNVTGQPTNIWVPNEGWDGPLLFIYILMGISAGTLFSQFPVVLAELVGLPRLAAAHALFMLIQVPVTTLKFISGIIKTATGTWGTSYIILFIILVVVTLINSVSLLLGPTLRRICCRNRNANAPAAHA